MKGRFKDNPLDVDDEFNGGKYAGIKVLKVLANDPGYILYAIQHDTWWFTEAVKKLAKESV